MFEATDHEMNLLLWSALSVLSSASANLEITSTPLPGTRIPKQIFSGMKDNEDRRAEASGFEENMGFGGDGGEGHRHGNYFMYQHLPKKDHYEFGFRRGNEHHVKERYEKAHPHQGQFKTKVKWGDKHGGHGEHYWDYNHGHHGDDEGSEGEEASQNVAQYEKKDDRMKREEAETSRTSLIFNTESGTATDPATGRVYVIYPLSLLTQA